MATSPLLGTCTANILFNGAFDFFKVLNLKNGAKLLFNIQKDVRGISINLSDFDKDMVKFLREIIHLIGIIQSRHSSETNKGAQANYGIKSMDIYL